jgi:hypothetical protein
LPVIQFFFKSDFFFGAVGINQANIRSKLFLDNVFYDSNNRRNAYPPDKKSYFAILVFKYTGA